MSIPSNCCTATTAIFPDGAAHSGPLPEPISQQPAATSGIGNILITHPKPTLDDARAWSMTFEKVMKSAAGRSCFRHFLRTEFSEENMMFWLACEELKKETNKTVVEEKVRKIYEDFISILSPKEVSLDSRVREVINRNMLEPTSHTFDDAQQQIYTLMQRDSYPRFINSCLGKRSSTLAPLV
uniref:Regulator of G protein signaling 20 n=1 Tax=Scophthalmus maximus TaxID=52904 RepID=A0A8D3DCD5_SCOMX